MNPKPKSTQDEAVEIIRTDSRRVACDGGGDLGHPRVWLVMESEGSADGQVMCPYCSRVYVLSDGE